MTTSSSSLSTGLRSLKLHQYQSGNQVTDRTSILVKNKYTTLSSNRGNTIFVQSSFRKFNTRNSDSWYKTHGKEVYNQTGTKIWSRRKEGFSWREISSPSQNPKEHESFSSIISSSFLLPSPRPNHPEDKRPSTPSLQTIRFFSIKECNSQQEGQNT